MIGQWRRFASLLFVFPSTRRATAAIFILEFLKGPRKSSVFPAPCRSVLHAADADYDEACRSSRAACGKAVSRQLYQILRKIGEVDRLVTPDRQRWLRESHPEVVLARLAGAAASPLAKKATPAGQRERTELLRGFFPALDLSWLQAERIRLRREARCAVQTDDPIDALACLVAARRIADGSERVFPEDAPEYDGRGLRMEITA